MRLKLNMTKKKPMPRIEIGITFFPGKSLQISQTQKSFDSLWNDSF